MNLREARVWVRYRSRMTKGVKANRASVHRNDMTCRCCGEDEAETQEHLEICKGTENEQRGLKNWNRWQTRVTFWQHMRKRSEEREEEEAMRRRQEKDDQKQHGCEDELRRESADYPEDGPADEPEATE